MQHPHQEGSWQQKEHHRRSHQHRARAVEGEIGHWVRTGAILAPLVIHEFVKDPDKKWRFIRVTSVAAAILSEGLHAHKNYKDRERDREALDACEMSCATL